MTPTKLYNKNHNFHTTNNNFSNFCKDPIVCDTLSGTQHNVIYIFQCLLTSMESYTFIVSENIEKRIQQKTLATSKEW